MKPQSVLKGVESDLVNVFLRDLAQFTKTNLKEVQNSSIKKSTKEISSNQKDLDS